MTRALAPLRVRSFALLWAGQTVSLVGNGVFTVALAWEALSLGGSRALSLVLVATFVPSTALLLAGGVVSDRRSRRATLVVCDLVQAVAVGGVALLATLDVLRVWHLALAGAVAGAASGFFLPASAALLPDVVPRDLLVRANSLNTIGKLTAGRLAGPALGGLLVASYGTAPAFAADAVSFLVSAACLSLLRVARRPVGASASAFEGLREGVAFCARRRWLRISLASFAVLNLGVSAPLAVLVPVYVRSHLGLGARALGLLLAVEGVGGAVAAVVAASSRTPRRLVVATHVSFAVAGASVAALGLVSSLVLAASALAAAGFLLELGNVYWTSALQENVPPNLLGRVSSVDWLVSGSLLPVGIAAVGALAASAGVAAVLLTGGLAAAAASLAVVAALSRGVSG
ncbi:MAG TPA: MFS transporter [Frankiaceae bacterium]|jgi:MFS family permease|nr:MFS transporter [Frankiaceae bacterium]